jgi:DNA-binding NtrC family response regulator
MPRILIIDDEDQIRKMLQQMFEREGFETVTASDGLEGVKAYREKPADLIITDLIMPEKEGIEIIFELKREFPDVKIIAISGGGRTAPEGYLKIADKAGALRTFSKPLERDELLRAVREILG